MLTSERRFFIERNEFLSDSLFFFYLVVEKHVHNRKRLKTILECFY